MANENKWFRGNTQCCIYTATAITKILESSKKEKGEEFEFTLEVIRELCISLHGLLHAEC